MTEFWESNFKDKKAMWGHEPVDSAIEIANLFRDKDIKNVLIPGIGYGRNAAVFYEKGMQVTGIEISETAIKIANEVYRNTIKIHHGSINEMPFGKDMYEGIYCYALLHLLNLEERKTFLQNCYDQLEPGGYMVFVTLSDQDFRFGNGKKISENCFLTDHGVNLYFYNKTSVLVDFDNFGLTECKEILDPIHPSPNKPVQTFWQITCRKPTATNT